MWCPRDNQSKLVIARLTPMPCVSIDFYPVLLTVYQKKKNTHCSFCMYLPYFYCLIEPLLEFALINLWKKIAPQSEIQSHWIAKLQWKKTNFWSLKFDAIVHFLTLFFLYLINIPHLDSQLPSPSSHPLIYSLLLPNNHPLPHCSPLLPTISIFCIFLQYMHFGLHPLLFPITLFYTHPPPSSILFFDFPGGLLQ